MLTWMIANMANLAIGTVILAAVTAAVRHCAKSAKSGGCTGCGGSCAHCGAEQNPGAR